MTDIITSPPGRYNFTIYQGATFNPTLTWQDGAGNNVNLTGYTGALMARDKVESEAPFITLTTENGGITLGGAAGTVALYMSAAATAALDREQGFYDLKLTSGAGVVTRLVGGAIAIEPQVTR